MSSTAAFARSPVLPIASESRTILIIEDYSDTRELLSAMLRGKGYKVIEAEDGVDHLLRELGHLSFWSLNFPVDHRERSGATSQHRALLDVFDRRGPIGEPGTDAGRTLLKVTAKADEEECQP